MNIKSKNNILIKSTTWAFYLKSAMKSGNFEMKWWWVLQLTCSPIPLVFEAPTVSEDFTTYLDKPFLNDLDSNWQTDY